MQCPVLVAVQSVPCTSCPPNSVLYCAKNILPSKSCVTAGAVLCKEGGCYAHLESRRRTGGDNLLSCYVEGVGKAGIAQLLALSQRGSEGHACLKRPCEGCVCIKKEARG
eukprot:1158990-Pelagomonas_calceolata.AAC.8